MREKILQIIEPDDKGCKLSIFYDVIMMLAIIASIIPLAFKTTNKVFNIIDIITVTIFIIDYSLRVFTADIKLKKGVGSFFIYPFTPMAIIDLLSILPAITVIHNSFKLLKLLRLLRAFKALRVLRFLRYSKSFELLINVFKQEKRVLGAVASVAVAYVIISALIIYNVEPETFNTFFDAVYWATISLTTVGYGDIYPVSTIGRVFTMLSSLFGIAIIALPSGVITVSYLSEINKRADKAEQEALKEKQENK